MSPLFCPDLLFPQQYRHKAKIAVSKKKRFYARNHLTENRKTTSLILSHNYGQQAAV